MTEAENTVIFSKFGVSVASKFQVSPTQKSWILDADRGFLRTNSAAGIQFSGVLGYF